MAPTIKSLSAHNARKATSLLLYQSLLTLYGSNPHLPERLPHFLFIILSSLCMVSSLISLSANQARKATYSPLNQSLFTLYGSNPNLPVSQQSQKDYLSSSFISLSALCMAPTLISLSANKSCKATYQPLFTLFGSNPPHLPVC
jgi:hypothetical protein